MTEGQPENVRLQISLENTQNNRIIETKLMSIHDILEKAVEWTNLFIDYYDMKMEDITFKLLSVEIPIQGQEKCQQNDNSRWQT